MKEIDKDWTPTKYIRLQEEMVLKNKTISKLRDLNMKLQENLIKAENKVESLEARVETLMTHTQPKPAAGIVLFYHVRNTCIYSVPSTFDLCFLQVKKCMS